MATLITSFGSDYIITEQKGADSSTMIYITSGFENCVTVNGKKMHKQMVVRKQDDFYVDRSDSSTIIGMYNAYDPDAPGYVDPNSSKYILHSQSQLATADSSLFIDADLPPKLSILRNISRYNSSEYDLYTIHDSSTYVYHVHIDSSVPFVMAIGKETAGGSTSEFAVIEHRPVTTNEEKYDHVQKLLCATSYELLRANPKLTGNIKVVVDSQSRLFLDTFKVNPTMSQSMYRKIKVNPDTYYGTALAAYMSKIPAGELFKIEDRCYDIFGTTNDINSQYYDTYNSGVRTNDDKMYAENFAMLAPIRIQRNMPDFFLIYKIKDYRDIKDDAERIKYFIKNGELMKAFDLRENSSVGKFIRNIYQHSRAFVGDMYTSRDYTHDNVFNGISLDFGSVTQIHESGSYDRNYSNQVAMNDWYTLGFERNRIVCKDIVNFEFMFDDTDEELFSVNTYFGIYVRLNGEATDFGCTGTDENGKLTFDSSISGIDFDPQNFTDVIYGFTSPDGFVKLDSSIGSEKTQQIIGKYKMKPYRNVAAAKIVNTLPPITNKQVISLTIDTLMDVGEHYRIIDTTNHVIYEVIMSNYIDNDFKYSEINCYEHEIGDVTYTVRRIAVYNIEYRDTLLELSDDEISAAREMEAELVAGAFRMFGSEIDACRNGNSIFILYDSTSASTGNVLLEKVSSYVGITKDASTYSKEYEDDSTHFFECENEKIVLFALSEDTLVKTLYPVGFEALGYRVAYACSFIPYESQEGTLHMIDRSVDHAIRNEKTLIYETADGKYETFSKIRIDVLGSDLTYHTQYVWSVPGYGTEDATSIRTKAEPDIDDGIFTLYNLYPLNCGICSIMPVRDIYTDVLDRRNTISPNPTDYISTDGGEFTNSHENVFGTTLSEYHDEETIMSYLDKYERVWSHIDQDGNTVYFNNVDQSNLSLYLSSIYANGRKSSDISLMSPYCCKWQLVGTDARGEMMRLMYSDDIDASSYYIPTEDDGYIGAIGASDAKGVDLGIYPEDFDKYRGEFSKYIAPYLDGRTHPGFRDFMFNGNGSIESVLNNHNGGTAKMSTAYLSGNSIEFVSGGLKMKISSSDPTLLNLSKYNGYSAIIISSSSNNNAELNPCEILIDETNAQIAVILYNGSTPWQMGYNRHNTKLTVNGEVQIPPAYPVRHETSFTKILPFRNSVIVTDDSHMADDDSSCMIVADSSYGICIMSSPKNSDKIFVPEEDAFIYSKITDKSLNKTTGKFRLMDPYLIIGNDSSTKIDKYNLSMTNKINETVDMFVLSHIDNSTDATISDASISEGYRTDRATMTVSEIRNALKNAVMTIKNSAGTTIYNESNGMFTASIVDPIYNGRENSKREQIWSKYPLYEHPCYCEPVTHDILEFRRGNDELNRIFGKCFDDCNIQISGVRNIDQIWLKKYTTEPIIQKNPFKQELYRTYNVDTVTDICEGDRLIDESGTEYEVVELNKSAATILDGLVGRFEFYKHQVDTSYGVFLEDPNARIEFDKKVRNNETGNIAALYELIKGEWSVKPDFKIIDSSRIDSSTVIIGSNYQQIQSAQLTLDGYFPTDQDYLWAVVEDMNGENKHSMQFYFKTTGMTITRTTHVYGQIKLRMVTDGALDYTNVSAGTIRNFTFKSDPSKYILLTYEYSTETPLYFAHPMSTTGLVTLHDFSPVTDCWDKKMFVKYNSSDECTYKTGIDYGCEKNTFLASHGLTLKSKVDGETVNSLTLTRWISKISGNSIILNVTDTLIDTILTSPGFVSIWENVAISDTETKNRYIKNTILPRIPITDECRLEIYASPSNAIAFNNNADFDKMEKMEGTNVQLYINNSDHKYYVKISGLDVREYSAKMLIRL